MDKIEAIGFKSYYGLSPSIDVFRGTDINIQSDTEEINILLSNTSDVRHVLKSLSDNLNPTTKRENPIHFYIHESDYENLCRDLLFLTIICETQLSFRERKELFLDLYGNTMIRSRTADYLDDIAVELSRLITEHRKCKSVLMDIIDLETLKFKERDDCEDVINTWRKSIPFDIESMRDQRLRAYFKTRYDSRKNLVDWDYSFNIKKFTNFIDKHYYTRFRLVGIAFETRLSEGVASNRTMSSYIEGKKKKSGDSCLVRGFWGDIINSPYIPLGIEVDNEEDRKKFDKEYNFQRPYNSADIAEYHIESYMTKLETLTDYVAPFEIIKQIEEGRHKDKKKEQSKVEEIEEVDEEQENDEASTQEETKTPNPEEDKVNTVTRDESKDRTLLEGFQRLNVKFHLLTGKISNLYQKSKYKGLFNIAVMSIKWADLINKDFNQLLAEGCYINVENGNNLVVFDDANRVDYIIKLKELTKEANWKELDDVYKHHCSFQYLGDDAEIPEYKNIPERIERKDFKKPDTLDEEKTEDTKEESEISK